MQVPDSSILTSGSVVVDGLSTDLDEAFLVDRDPIQVNGSRSPIRLSFFIRVNNQKSFFMVRNVGSPESSPRSPKSPNLLLA